MHFRFLALGENFLMVVEGESKLMGWYKAVWVECSNLEEAKSRALNVIGTELIEAEIETTQRSTISWDEIEEVEDRECPETPRGFTFFEMEN